jgi:hypothetical protein
MDAEEERRQRRGCSHFENRCPRESSGQQPQSEEEEEHDVAGVEDEVCEVISRRFHSP